MFDINRFRSNQSRFPLEQLEKYSGQYVAWSPDGTRIVAADPDPLRMDVLLRAAGYDPSEVLVSRVAIPEDVSWNGWSFPDDADFRGSAQEVQLVPNALFSGRRI